MAARRKGALSNALLCVIEREYEAQHIFRCPGCADHKGKLVQHREIICALNAFLDKGRYQRKARVRDFAEYQVKHLARPLMLLVASARNPGYQRFLAGISASMFTYMFVSNF